MRDKTPQAVRRRAGYDELERAVKEHDRKLIAALKEKQNVKSDQAKRQQ